MTSKSLYRRFNMVSSLPDLIRPTTWSLSVRTWWGGVYPIQVQGCYPEDALEAYEQSGQGCDRVVEMSYYCLIEQRWKVLAERDMKAAIVLVRGVR